MKVLIVDLLAERHGFGKQGVRNIVDELQPDELFLWSPHTDQPLDYGIGTRVDGPVECDLIVISGSRKNVSMWEDWMDEVARLIRTCDVPLYGICFGHQIIAATLGGKVTRADRATESVCSVDVSNGRTIYGLFSHQDHVVESGEMLNIGSSEACGSVVHVHPTRPIYSVQFHPETDEKVLAEAVEHGEMSQEERQGYVFEHQVFSLAEFFSPSSFPRA
ncbi:MAG: hypothetical protein VW230_01320 [Candidatus Poseidoniales archaeon]